MIIHSLPIKKEAVINAGFVQAVIQLLEVQKM